MFKLKYIFILFLTVCCPAIYAADSASSIINKCVAKIKSAPSVKVEFTVSVGNRNANGTITIAGDKFAITTPDGSTWFDGKTMWTHSISTNEVNISEPTHEEIAEINPIAIIGQAETLFNMKTISSSASNTVIELTPKNQKKSEISKAAITINTKSNFPEKMSFVTNGKTSIVSISKINVGKQLPSKVFSFNKSMFPNAEIIDLR